jgi:hypothetical protein
LRVEQLRDSPGFLLGLFFNSEDGGDMLAQNNPEHYTLRNINDWFLFNVAS